MISIGKAHEKDSHRKLVIMSGRGNAIFDLAEPGSVDINYFSIFLWLEEEYIDKPDVVKTQHRHRHMPETMTT
jgi:hypothetical protein